jgi:hypothetical protein
MRLTIVVISLAALAAGGTWWWHAHRKDAPIAAAADAKEDQKRADALYDSLGALDFSIREAQETQDSVPQALVDDQARLWNRYADLRSRMAAEQVDSVRLDDAPNGALSPALAILKRMPEWIWIAVVAAALLLLLLRWLLRRSVRAQEEEPESFPKPRTLRESLSPWDSSSPSAELPAHVPAPSAPARPATAPQPASAPPAARPEAPLPRRTIDPTFTASSWENTRTTPPSSAVEPSAMQDMILSLSKRGHTPSEIARRLRLPQDQVSLILKLRQAP